MTIDNVLASEVIDPAWGNAVADQINANTTQLIKLGDRTITVSSSDPTGGAIGDIWIKV